MYVEEKTKVRTHTFGLASVISFDLNAETLTFQSSLELKIKFFLVLIYYIIIFRV